jgi:hypothetical protein
MLDGPQSTGANPVNAWIGCSKEWVFVWTELNLVLRGCAVARRACAGLLFVIALHAVPGGLLSAQRLEARLGVQVSSTLVDDLGATGALTRGISAVYSSPVTLRLSPAPVVSVGLVHDIAQRAALELMGSVAVSKLNAATRDLEWHAQDVSMATLSTGVRFHYRPRLDLHGGLGLTRFFTESSGIFSEGSSTLPLLELGVSSRLPVGALPVRASARVQAHTFGTPALRRDGATDGRVVRLLVQVGLGG